MSLLDQLMKKLPESSQQTQQTVKKLSEQLSDVNVDVVLTGVNAPEFDAEISIDAIDDVDDPMDFAFEQKPSTAAIRLPDHDDDLEDDEIELTPDHFQDGILDDQEETVDMKKTVVYDHLPWQEKPWNARFFNFGGRTRNSLTRAGLHNFNQIRGMSKDELLGLKGFGKGCLDEILEVLVEVGRPDWISEYTPSTEASKNIEALPPAPIDAVEDTDQPAPIDVVEDTDPPAPIGPENPTQDATPPAPIEPMTKNLKIVAVGNVQNITGLRVASFESVYGDILGQIAQQAQRPTVALVDFGKGWGLLGAAIRDKGWPEGVDVIQVSPHTIRQEFMLELSLLADIVIG